MSIMNSMKRDMAQFYEGKINEQAAAILAANRGKATPNIYVAEGATKMTKERAYAQALEDSPLAYEQMRRQHNAKHLVATLEAAGVRIEQ